MCYNYYVIQRKDIFKPQENKKECVLKAHDESLNGVVLVS